MRISAFIVAMIFASSCFAVPTTQPVNEPPQMAVFTFNNVGQTNQAGVAQAIEENFIAELSRGGVVWPVRATADSKDQNGAMTTARNSGATYILTGAYQMVGDELRATGQIIAVSDGHVIGGLTATGATRDLFTIEDTLATQAKHLLAPPAGPVVIGQPIQPSGPVMQNEAVVSNDFLAAAYQPVETYLPQYNQYIYYSVPYSYIGYAGGTCYGFGGGGIGYFHPGFSHGFGGFRGGHHIGYGGSGAGRHSTPW